MKKKLTTKQIESLVESGFLDFCRPSKSVEIYRNNKGILSIKQIRLALDEFNETLPSHEFRRTMEDISITYGIDRSGCCGDMEISLFISCGVLNPFDNIEYVGLISDCLYRKYFYHENKDKILKRLEELI